MSVWGNQQTGGLLKRMESQGILTAVAEEQLRVSYDIF